jgi:hypothetical protein
MNENLLHARYLILLSFGKNPFNEIKILALDYLSQTDIYLQT